MNASKGLQRISAVWWGFIGILFVAVSSNDWKGDAKLYAPVAILAGAYGLHWLTCWIVKGFFGDGD